MIKLNFHDGELNITTDCGCFIASDCLHLTDTDGMIIVYSSDNNCHCHKHSVKELSLAGWIAASWEFNFPNGFTTDSPDGVMYEFEGYVTRESFDKALQFVECFKALKPLPVQNAA